MEETTFLQTSSNQNNKIIPNMIVRLSPMPILIAFTFYAISFGLIIPAFPLLLNQFTGSNLEKSSLYFGIANLLKHSLDFFASPIIGTFSDSIGRKPLLLYAFGMVSIEYLLIGLFPHLYTMILSKIIAGCGDSCFLMTYTILTDISIYNKENLTTYYGYVSGAWSIGFIIGPIIGSYIQTIYSTQLVFLISGFCNIIAFIYIYFNLIETNQNKREFKDIRTKMNPFITLVTFFKDKKLAILSIPYSIVYLTGGFYIIFVLHLSSILHASNTMIGYYLSTYGILQVIIDLFVINYIIPTYLSDEIATCLFMGFECIRFICYGFSTTFVQFYIIMILFSMTSIHQISLKTIIYKASKHYPQGSIQGALGSIRTLALGIGGILYSSIYSFSLEYGTKYAHVTFLVAAFVLGCGTFYLGRICFDSMNDSTSGSYNNSNNEVDEETSYLVVEMHQQQQLPNHHEVDNGDDLQILL